MRQLTVPAKAYQRYTAAHDAHHKAKELHEALTLYRMVMVAHPHTVEAKFSRVQIGSIVSSVVPKQALFNAQVDLALDRKAFENKLTIIYKIGYVPVFGVHGWMEGQMTDENGNIMIYSGGLEYPIDDRVAFTVGYRHVELTAEVVEDKSTAIVTLGGFYGGMTFSF